MNSDHDIDIGRLDWSHRDDIAGYLAVLDDYARDPMGRGEGLPGDVLHRLAVDLADHPAVQVLLARGAAGVVGAATCFLGYSTFQARPLLNVHDIAVLAPARGRGIGRLLMAGIEDLARELDCCRVTLEVRSDNPRAMHLYEASGFRAGACDRFMEKPL